MGARRPRGHALPCTRVDRTGTIGPGRAARTGGGTVIAARRAAGIVLLATACRGAPTGGEPEPCPTPVSAVAPPQAALAARPSPFDSAFAAASAEFRVPSEVLKGIAWVETRWQMVEGREEFAGQPPAFGVMALRGAALERAAKLAGVTTDRARHDPVANIRAAAALLDAYAAEGAIDRSRMEQWSGVVVRYSGLDLPAGRAAYLSAERRALGLAPRRPALPQAPCPPGGGAPDYAAATWRASPNFDQRAADSTGT